MNEFIIVTKPLELTIANKKFLCSEYLRFRSKGCKLGCYIKDNYVILVREIDDSIFLDTEYNVLNYKINEKKAIEEIKNEYKEGHILLNIIGGGPCTIEFKLKEEIK